MKKTLLFTLLFLGFSIGYSNEKLANPNCPAPTAVVTTLTTPTTFVASWTENGTATLWEIIVLPCGVPAPTAAVAGYVVSTSNPFVFTGLTPGVCYDVYVRSVCDPENKSLWSGSNSIITTPMPACGGTFTDNGGIMANYNNNSGNTITICPSSPGDVVTVVFTSFDIESNNDALYVYDGTSSAAPMISSGNGSTAVGPAGGFWGTTNPGPFTATNPTGCLTFVFISNGSITGSGWTADIICGPLSDITLTAFIDANNNGNYDANEATFADGSFVYQVNDSGTNTYATSNVGSYRIVDTTFSNSYDFSYSVNPEFASYLSNTTTYNNVTITPTGGNQFLYFPISVTNPFNDVSVVVLPTGQPRPGFSYTNTIMYKNIGVATASGTLTFTKDPEITVTDVSQSGIITNANGFTYDYTDLAPNETRYIHVIMNVPTIPTVNINDILTNSASITSGVSEISLTNNSSSSSQIVIGSYDPNDKMESHGGQIVHSTFTSNDYLYYTVRFENTGTASAIKVRIEDALDTKLNENSFSMISASHDYTVDKVGNNLIWKFEDIYLPPSVPDTNIGKGYVTFRVKPKPGYAVGDIIENTANIYFDFNPAIVTNTFTTEFVALGNAEFESGSFVLSPNPANESVNIQLQNTTETISLVTITDIVGKTIRNVESNSGNQMNVDVSDLSKGIYLIEITTANHSKTTKKLVMK